MRISYLISVSCVVSAYANRQSSLPHRYDVDYEQGLLPLQLENKDAY